MGKEPELVQEVERYRLDAVRLTSARSLGPGVVAGLLGWMDEWMD